MFIEDNSQVSLAKFGVVGERGERASHHGGARPHILSGPSASRRVCEVQRAVGMTCLKWALGLGTGLFCPSQALWNCGPQCTWEESADIWGHRSCSECLHGAGRIRGVIQKYNSFCLPRSYILVKKEIEQVLQVNNNNKKLKYQLIVHDVPELK